MATNNRDVQLVIRARNEASAAIDSVSKALSSLASVQDQVSKGSKDTGTTLGAMGDAFAKLNNTLKSQTSQSANDVAKAYEQISNQADITTKTLKSQQQALAGTKAEYAAVKQQITSAEQAIVSIALKMRQGGEDALAGRLKAAQTAYSGLNKEATRLASSLPSQESKIEQTAASLKTIESAATAAQAALRDLQRAPAVTSSVTSPAASPAASAAGPAAAATAAYRAQVQAVQQAKTAYDQARAAATALGAEMAHTAEPTVGLQVAFTSSKLAAQQANIEYQKQATSLNALKGSAAGSFSAFDKLASSMEAEAAAARKSAAAQVQLQAEQKAAAATAARSVNTQTVQTGRDAIKSNDVTLIQQLGTAYKNLKAQLLGTSDVAAQASSALTKAGADAAKTLANIDAPSLGPQTKEMADAAAKLRAQIDPLGSIQNKLNRELAEAQALYKSGAISAKEYAQAQVVLAANAKKSGQELTRAAAANKSGFLGLRPYELQNLSYQINDIFTQLASGTSLTQTLSQQGGQIFQLFYRQIAKLLPVLAAWAPEIVVAAGAIVTLGLAVNQAFDKVELVRKFNAEIAATAEGATYTGKALADSVDGIEKFGVSAKDATAAVQTMRKAGIDPTLFTKFAKAAKDAAKVTGKEFPDALKELTEGVSKGYDAVKKLDDEYDYLTAAERAHIKAMFEAGDAAGARTLALDLFNQKMGDAADKATGPWSQAWRNLTNAFKGFIDWIANSAPIQFLVDLMDRLGKGVESLTSLLPGAESPAAVAGAAVGARYGQAASAGSVPKGEQIDRIVRATTELAEKMGVSAKDLLTVFSYETGGTLNPHQKGPTTQYGQHKGLIQFGEPQAAKYGFSDSSTIEEQLKSIGAYLKDAGVKEGDGLLKIYAAVNAGNVNKVHASDENNGGAPGDVTDKVYGKQMAQHAAKAQALIDNLGKTAQDTVAVTEQSIKTGQDYIDELQKQKAVTGEASDAEKIRKAGLDEVAKAQAKGITDPKQIETIRQLAEETKKRALAAKQASDSDKLTSSETAKSLSLAKAGNQSLDSILAGVTKKYNEARDSADKFAKVHGPTLDNGQSIDAYKEQLATNEAIEKSQQTQIFYEKQKGDLAKQQKDALDGVNAQLKSGSIDAQTAAQQTQAIYQKFQPQFQDLSDKAIKFADSVKSAVPDPKLDKFLSDMRTAPADALGTGIKTTLAQITEGIKELTKARDDAIATIKTQQGAGQLNSTDAQTQVQGVLDRFNPEIAKLADYGKQFAQSISGAKPSPELVAFTNNAQKAQSAATSQGTTGPLAQFGQANLAQQYQQLNAAIQERNQLVQANNALQQQGAITATELEARNKAAYANSTPAIQAQIDKLRELLQVLLQQGTITQTTYDAWAAKLQLVGTQTTYVSQAATQMSKSLANSFVGDVTGAFDTFAQSIAAGKGAMESLRGAFLKFASDFLKQIAQMILKQALFSALGMGSMGTGTPSGMFGGIFTAFAGLFHEGGVVGRDGGTRLASPAWFANAPRYHDGGIAGLKPGEVPAILQKNEEVLTQSDPRNILNGGASGGGASAGSQSLKVVNVFDPADAFTKALGSTAGEKVLLNYVRENQSAFRAALGT